jgi:hypothetical protein
VLIVLAVGLSVVSSSCSTTEVPQGERIQFSAGELSEDGELQFQVPEGWIEEEPSSGMRKAQYRLPGSESSGGDAEVAVFAGIGGSVEQNVSRWISQFEAAEAPQVNKRTISGYPVTVVDISGTFSGGAMTAGAGAKQGHRMLAAVIETGSAPWFVKLTGPVNAVKKWENSFDSYIQSLK